MILNAVQEGLEQQVEIKLISFTEHESVSGLQEYCVRSGRTARHAGAESAMSGGLCYAPHNAV